MAFGAVIDPEWAHVAVFGLGAGGGFAPWWIGRSLGKD
jgi:hypothetical protein